MTMLNRTNIKNRLRTNPEPKIVGEIRDEIINKFKDLVFNEEPHTYFVGDKQLMSVSEFCHKFEPFKDWDLIAEKKAIKDGVDKDDLKAKWDYDKNVASYSGTIVHLYAECLDNYTRTCDPNVIHNAMRLQFDKSNGVLYPSSLKQQAAQMAIEHFFGMENVYPVLAETMVYNDYYAGTFDKLVYIKRDDGKKSGLYILDWKTNGNLYSQYNRTMGNMMLPPFDTLYDENIGKYSIQQSAYQIPLEDMGLPVIGRALIWLKIVDGNPQYEIVKLKNYTKQIRQFINEH